MNLVERAQVYLGYKQIAVHCQYCGEDITGVGAAVTPRETVYCKERCFLEVGKSKPEEYLLVDVHFQSPREVQRAIATGEITHYSALETKALE